MIRRLLLSAAVLALAACQAGPETVVEGPGAPPPSGGGRMCGGLAAVRCSSAQQYCYMTPEQTRIPDMSGVCRPMPQACTLDYRPVCGVDGVTYGNPCDAAAHGVNVSREGRCAPG